MGAREPQSFLQNGLRQAVSRKELFVLFQPCLDLHTKSIIGTEALLRWRHPLRGVIPPDVFIPLAEDCGSIVDIGKWVLRAACTQNKRWHDIGLTWLRVAVNVSAVQLQEPGFVSDVADILAQTGLDACFLELEITETAFIRDIDAVVEVLLALKSSGVTISIDDFGTGYSWLSYLQRFPADILKIDKSFVHGITTNRPSRAIIQSLIQLAKVLQLTVVAEGVETQGQYRFLQEQQCDRLQGYLIGWPVEPEKIVPLAVATERSARVRGPLRTGGHASTNRGRHCARSRVSGAWYPNPVI